MATSKKTNGAGKRSRLKRAGRPRAERESLTRKQKDEVPKLSQQQKDILLRKFRTLQGAKVAWADAARKADGIARQVAHMQADFEETCQSALRGAGVDLESAGAHTVSFSEGDVEIVAGGPPAPAK